MAHLPGFEIRRLKDGGRTKETLMSGWAKKSDVEVALKALRKKHPTWTIEVLY